MQKSNPMFAKTRETYIDKREWHTESITGNDSYCLSLLSKFPLTLTQCPNSKPKNLYRKKEQNERNTEN